MVDSCKCTGLILFRNCHFSSDVRKVRRKCEGQTSFHKCICTCPVFFFQISTSDSMLVYVWCLAVFLLIWHVTSIFYQKVWNPKYVRTSIKNNRFFSNMLSLQYWWKVVKFQKILKWKKSLFWWMRQIRILFKSKSKGSGKFPELLTELVIFYKLLQSYIRSNTGYCQMIGAIHRLHIWFWFCFDYKTTIGRHRHPIIT